VRIVIWHGWLLEGSGSNVVTARTAERLRASGHDVLLLCQEPHPERFDWVDAWGALDRATRSELTPNPSARPASGRCVVLRPTIGPILPVFVLDPYEGFDDVRRFVDLDGGALEAYLDHNVEALANAAAEHDPEVSIVGHAIPGAAIGRRALGADRYVAKVHGSDLEYAIRPQGRYRELAAEGLLAAHAVVGPTREVIARCAELVPGVDRLGRIVPPGVDVEAFRPMARADALADVADRLDADPDIVRGRPASFDEEVAHAVAARDLAALDALLEAYDHDAPDPDAAARLRTLIHAPQPIVGYLGKLIPQKGVELLVQALALIEHDVRALIVGFGAGRERLAALVHSIEQEDGGALAWLREATDLPVELDRHDPGRAIHITFTGRLDHRYAPGAFAAMDVCVVPSILDEAFGVVVAEASAAGALPLVARHSGLAEVAATLEAEVDRPDLFSFDPGPGAVRRIADGIDRLLSLPPDERRALSVALEGLVRERWTWDRVCDALLDAARGART
jgi:glycosyltransferase involved in cell wall biosynthesis